MKRLPCHFPPAEILKVSTMEEVAAGGARAGAAAGTAGAEAGAGGARAGAGAGEKIKCTAECRLASCQLILSVTHQGGMGLCKLMARDCGGLYA